jgi:hypothetical protein
MNLNCLYSTLGTLLPIEPLFTRYKNLFMTVPYQATPELEIHVFHPPPPLFFSPLHESVVIIVNQCSDTNKEGPWHFGLENHTSYCLLTIMNKTVLQVIFTRVVVLVASSQVRPWPRRIVPRFPGETPFPLRTAPSYP